MCACTVAAIGWHEWFTNQWTTAAYSLDNVVAARPSADSPLLFRFSPVGYISCTQQSALGTAVHVAELPIDHFLAPRSVRSQEFQFQDPPAAVSAATGIPQCWFFEFATLFGPSTLPLTSLCSIFRLTSYTTREVSFHAKGVSPQTISPATFQIYPSFPSSFILAAVFLLC